MDYENHYAIQEANKALNREKADSRIEIMFSVIFIVSIFIFIANL